MCKIVASEREGWADFGPKTWASAGGLGDGRCELLAGLTDT